MSSGDSYSVASHPARAARGRGHRPGHRSGYRAAAQISLDDPGGAARLLDILREVDANEQVTARVARDLAAGASV